MAEAQIFMSYASGKSGPIQGYTDLGGDISSGPAGDKWIPLGSCEFSAAPRSAPGMSRVELRPVKVTKMTDGATCLLLSEAFYNVSDSEIDIAFLQPAAGGTGHVEYLRLELRNCGVVSFDMDGGQDERWTETWEFHFGTMTITSWKFEGGVRGSPASVQIEAGGNS